MATTQSPVKLDEARAEAWDEGWAACASFAEGAINPYRAAADIAAEVKAQQTEEDLIELRRLGLA